MIGMIAAIGKNNELGKDNKLLWRVPNDMKFFKRTTMEHKVIMGFNTYKSLPPTGLPGREIIVLTNEQQENTENVKFVEDINEIIDNYLESPEEVFIAGGASMYRQFLPYVNYMYLTELDFECKEADVYYPFFDKEEWNPNLLEEGTSNNINYKIYKYVRKKQINK